MSKEITNREFVSLTPEKVAKRSKSIPTICVIGPTGSGKTTLIYSILNHRLVGIIQVGIGEKKQTTIIPTNFICDERIESENQVALKICRKKFAAKDVHYNVMQKLADLYNDKDIDNDEWADNLDEEFIEDVFEPSDKAYHLKELVPEINLDNMRAVLLPLLEAADKSEPSFSDRVTEKKKMYPKSSKKPMTEIRRMVFEDIIENLGDESPIWREYYKWLDAIGKLVEESLGNVLGENPNEDSNEDKIYEFDLGECGVDAEGARVLQQLFNPYKPYSLIIEEMTLISRPRKELIELNSEDYPLRFCLKDTMGLNQLDDGEAYIKEALDVALSTIPDSIMLLLNLEERDKTLSESCEAIEKKLREASKLDVPVRILLTKADRIIESKINANKEAVSIQLTDYESHILPAIEEVENLSKGYYELFPEQKVDWLSLRYHEEKIDPIQLSLKKLGSEQIHRFTPEGLYNCVYSAIEDTQKRILPKGIKYPVFVSVIDENAPAIGFSVNEELLQTEIGDIQNKLVLDKALVNGYQITDSTRIHGRSVVCYYNNLRQGRGYTTRAKVYGNFSINMKGMLLNLLRQYLPEFMTMYNAKAIKTVTDNIGLADLEKIIKVMDVDGSLSEDALKDVNPALVESQKDRDNQVLHYIFKNYFTSEDKYYLVIDKVAKKLSYNNKWVSEQIDEIYQRPISYDETIRMMQKRFLEIFGTKEFSELIVKEIEKAMTEIANKMFVVI